MKRNTRRTTAACVGALASVSLLASACGGTSGKTTGNRGDGSSDKVVTVTYWSWLKGQQDAVNAFNATHKDVRVQFSQIPSGAAGGYDKITNAVKAGDAPDLATVEYPMLPGFVNQGLLQPLPSAGAATLKAKYPTSVQQLVTLGGKGWALPRDIGSMVLFYRKDFFDKNKIQVPATWDEYKNAATVVKKADPKVRIGSFWNDDAGWLTALAWQGGAQWFTTQSDAWKVNVDSPQSKKVAAYWQDLVKNDLVVSQGGGDPFTQSIQKGQVVSFVGGAWNAGVLKGLVPGQSGKWATAQIPSWTAGQPVSGGYGGSTIALTKGSKKAAKALEFMTWLTTTPEGIKAQLSSGTSSALPAAPDLVPVAGQTFDTSFYGGEDIYSVAEKAVPTIAPWTWGPATATTNTALKEGLGSFASGSGDLTSVFGPAQQKTVSDLKTRGLSVAP